MKKLMALFGAGLMATTIGLATVGSTQPAEAVTNCSGTISGRTINQTIRVQSGVTCNIVNSTVNGDVIAYSNARLKVSNSVVNGGVQGTGAYSFEVSTSRVRGSIASESGQHTLIRSNIINGSVDLWNNRAPQRVFRNSIGVRIACAGNKATLTGALNTLGKGVDGQCAGMKQVAWLEVPEKTWERNSNGTVTVGGQLKVYNTFGARAPLGNQKVVIELRQRGGHWVSWTEATTSSSGQFSKSFGQVPGAEVRVVYPSTSRQISWAYAYGGRITSQTGPALNLAREGMWDRIAECESNQRWGINTGNGYYGGLQFNLGTWRSVDGHDFASYPHHASREEQITVANRLYAQRGLQPWGCRHAA